MIDVIYLRTITQIVPIYGVRIRLDYPYNYRNTKFKFLEPQYT